MGGNGTAPGRGPRCIAIVGPQYSGKTKLFESILARTGASGHEDAEIRKSVGDTTPEALEFGMSVELNIASFSYLGDSFTLIDCPGSMEMQHEGAMALPVCDA